MTLFNESALVFDFVGGKKQINPAWHLINNTHYLTLAIRWIWQSNAKTHPYPRTLHYWQL